MDPKDLDLVKLGKTDPLKRTVEKGLRDEGLSPMSPPDAYAPPGADQSVPYDQMHPVLQALRDEHESAKEAVQGFEDALIALQKDGIRREADAALRAFFEAIDENVIPHNRKEEKILFPLLAQRLLENGEHSKGADRHTAVDMLESDHLEIVQLSAVVLNFFALAGRLPDENSRLLVFDAAIEQGKALVELLRLHIFREDTVVFSLAHKYITVDEFDQLDS